jgi:restriction endonuclease Mrr
VSYPDDVVAEQTFDLSPDEVAELHATGAGQTLAGRGDRVTWSTVRQTLRDGRVRWLTRGNWPGRPRGAPGTPESGQGRGSGGRRARGP